MRIEQLNNREWLGRYGQTYRHEESPGDDGDCEMKDETEEDWHR